MWECGNVGMCETNNSFDKTRSESNLTYTSWFEDTLSPLNQKTRGDDGEDGEVGEDVENDNDDHDGSDHDYSINPTN